MEQPGHDSRSALLYPSYPSQRPVLPNSLQHPDSFPHVSSPATYASTQSPWPIPRRSSDTLLPSSSQHQNQNILHQQQLLPHHPDSSIKQSCTTNPEDGMASTSDFVKKLYKMLEDQAFQHVVSWGPQGDCFVVKDMNEFTKSILPRMFKHSNFASFVRQLNKYDFHKVKNTDDNQFGEHSWTFRHPDFHADRRDALENIKRKVPTQRKPMSTTAPPRSMSSTSPGPYSSSSTVEALQHQVDRLNQAHDDMSAHVRSLERSYQDVLVEMVNFQRNMAQQDNLMQNLIQYFLNSETAKAKRSGNILADFAANSGSSNSFSQDAQRLLRESSNAGNTAAATLLQMSGSGRPENDALNFNGGGGNDLESSSLGNGRSGLGRPQETTSRLWQDAANAGLMNTQELNAGGTELEKAISRQEALSKLEELRRQQSTGAQMLSALYGMVGKGPDGVQRAGDVGSSSSSLGSQIKDDPIKPSADALAAAQAAAEASSSNSVRWGGNSDGGQGEASTSSSSSNLIPSWKDVTDASGNQLSQQGLEVYTLANLMPKGSFDSGNSNGSNNWSFGTGDLGDVGLSSLLGTADDSSQQTTDNENSPLNFSTSSTPSTNAASPLLPSNSDASSSSLTPSASTSTLDGSSQQQRKLTVRRTTIVPAWTVPPRVLLVDDDAVSRKLSSKFLQVFGCTIDVAVDGVGAVNKMNLEKYDLVLMDIVMPKLDGISATSIIRGFDRMTPIISMTSNSKPNEIMTYFSSGMNDILAKPFTKQSLLDVLEKHLMHLKLVQHLSQVPRSVGVPPLSDSAFEQALTTHANAITNSQSMGVDGFMSVGGDDGRSVNPLASMGLSDEMYQAMLQNLINTGQFPGDMGGDSTSIQVGFGLKRSLEDDGSEGGPSGKRSRFEVLE